MAPAAAKLGDKVVSNPVDTHIILITTPFGTVPTPMPMPFNGLITSDVSKDVFIEGSPAATLGSLAINTPPHIPIGGPFQKPPTNQGRIIRGSTGVFINGKPAARLGDTAITCNDPVDLPVGTVIALGGRVFIGETWVSLTLPFEVVITVRPDGTVEARYGSSIVIQGSQAFVDLTIESLNRLMRQPSGRQLIEAINSNPNQVTIRETSNGNVYNADSIDHAYRQPGDAPSKGSSGVIEYNPERTQVGDGAEPWETRPPEVGLQHELYHSYQGQLGTLTRGRVSSGEFQGTRNTEMDAVGLGPSSGNPMTENALRSDMHEPPRERYFD
ncbi:PAAR domain-containing protein [Candidatus Bathyarchaeota archaeon]|nr:PAAR domain-containing protein [Candidatus Bathyarchaeota archaeon]MBS7627869.1 PAAR domain-containing protein [Candidatus Bathyarchaeota archaeon]